MIALMHKHTTKFKIDDKVMTPVSDVPGTVMSITMRRNRSYYVHDDRIYTYYEVNIPLREIGKASFTSVTVEYGESSLTSATA